MTGYSGFLGCIVACLVSVVVFAVIASKSGLLAIVASSESG